MIRQKVPKSEEVVDQTIKELILGILNSVKDKMTSRKLTSV